MDDTEPDYQRLANEVQRARRMSGRSQNDVAALGGPSDTTQSQIEAGTWRSARPSSTLRKLDRGLGWPPGTAQQVLEGGDAPSVGPSVEAYEREQRRMDMAWSTDLAELRALEARLPSIDVRSLEDLGARLLHQRDEITRSLRQASATVADFETQLAAVTDLFDRVALERDIRERFSAEEIEAARVRIVDFEELRSLLGPGAMLGFEVDVSTADQPAADAVAMLPDGSMMVIEVKHLVDQATAREAVKYVERLVAGFRDRHWQNVRGYVLDTQGTPWVELRPQLSDLTLTNVAFLTREQNAAARDNDVTEAEVKREIIIDSWRDREEADPWSEAARDIGKLSRGQDKRRVADQAGDPPADDPDDMEPR